MTDSLPTLDITPDALGKWAVISAIVTFLTRWLRGGGFGRMWRNITRVGDSQWHLARAEGRVKEMEEQVSRMRTEAENTTEWAAEAATNAERARAEIRDLRAQVTALSGDDSGSGSSDAPNQPATRPAPPNEPPANHSDS